MKKALLMLAAVTLIGGCCCGKCKDEKSCGTPPQTTCTKAQKAACDKAGKCCGKCKGKCECKCCKDKKCASDKVKAGCKAVEPAK